MKTALITGITGQDGSYLAKLLLNKGYNVIGVVRKKKSLKNLVYLKINNEVILEEVNLLNKKEIDIILKKHDPDEIYNFAAQSSVGQSYKKPLETFHFNTISVLNMLDSIKNTIPNAKFYQASSSEMFGKVSELPITLKTPMNPVSPYGVSKLSAHQLVLNYRESFGLYCVNGVLFNHESHLRRDNFFIKKVIKDSLLIKRNKLSYLNVGDLSVKRDFGYAPLYVEAIWKMLQLDIPNDYLVCSGISVKLIEIVEYIFLKLDISKKLIKINDEFIRPNEIQDIYGDNSLAKQDLNWHYNFSFFQILDILINEEIESQNFS